MSTRIALVLAVLGCAAQAQNIGSFESHADIGANPRAGSAVFDGGAREYRITGGGANIWGAEDAFHFVYSRWTGDGALTADVSFSGTGTDPHRKAVLMFRQDLTPGSAYADIAVHGDGLTALQYRPSAGGATAEVRASATAPARMRIERRGNTFTVFTGKPGEELTTAATQTVELKDPIYAGLGVSAHNADVLETAVFSSVRVEPLRPAAAPQQGQQWRSRVTIYDLHTRRSETVYEGDGVIEAPNWSRDGQFLLVNTGGHLYRLPVNAAQRKLEKIDLRPDGYRCNNDHDFSRDGKLLAFSASSPQSRQSQVFVANADGSGVRLLTPRAPSYFHGWSPDGQWLAFVGQREGKFELFRVSVDGGEEQRLTSAGAYDDGPEYTPDGRWIYFNSNRSGAWDVWRMPAEGAGVGDAKAERVTSDEWEDWFPHFSPDGKQMLVFSFPKGTEGHNDRMPGVALRLAPAPGGKLEPVRLETLFTFFGGQGTINVNSWAPDSRRFAYVVYEPLSAR